MPIYEYQCQTCNHLFELLQKRDEPAPGACPACGATSLKKQVTAGSFHLKGGGWYVTDYKDNNKKGAADSTSASKSKDSMSTQEKPATSDSSQKQSASVSKNDTKDKS